MHAGSGGRRSVPALTEWRIWQGAAARTLVGESGWLLACPHEPDEGRREGSLAKSAAALVTAWSSAAPGVMPFRASRPALARPARRVSRVPAGTPSRRCERPRGAALKVVQEVLTEPERITRPSRLMLYTWASLDA